MMIATRLEATIRMFLKRERERTETDAHAAVYRCIRRRRKEKERGRSCYKLQCTQAPESKEKVPQPHTKKTSKMSYLFITKSARLLIWKGK